LGRCGLALASSFKAEGKKEKNRSSRATFFLKKLGGEFHALFLLACPAPMACPAPEKRLLDTAVVV
jgi:hypothetical protein